MFILGPLLGGGGISGGEILPDNCMSKLFIGGLAWGTTEETLEELFSTYGEIVEVNIVRDRESGRSRGFGFVQFSTEENAQKAMDALNGTEVEGRTIRVDFAKERKPRKSGGGSYDR